MVGLPKDNGLVGRQKGREGMKNFQFGSILLLLCIITFLLGRVLVVVERDLAVERHIHHHNTYDVEALPGANIILKEKGGKEERKGN